jgi:hypothetical protein
MTQTLRFMFPQLKALLTALTKPVIDYGAIVLLFENGSDNHPTLKLEILS